MGSGQAKADGDKKDDKNESKAAAVDDARRELTHVRPVITTSIV